MTATQTPLAIIIEDNVHHGRILQEYLVREGFEVLLCATILEGESVTRAILSKAKAFRPSVVIIDQELVLQGHKDVEGSTLARFCVKRSRLEICIPPTLSPYRLT